MGKPVLLRCPMCTNTFLGPVGANVVIRCPVTSREALDVPHQVRRRVLRGGHIVGFMTGTQMARLNDLAKKNGHAQPGRIRRLVAALASVLPFVGRKDAA